MGALTHNGEVLQRLPANASQINFDKTGTDLNSTQTEAAIKEVNTKANTNAADITQLKSGLTNWEVAGQASTDSDVIKSQTNTIYVNRALQKVRLVANITFKAYNRPNYWIVMYYIPEAYIPQVIQSDIIYIGAKAGLITKNNVNGIIAFTPTDAIAEDDTSDICFEWYY